MKCQKMIVLVLKPHGDVLKSLLCLSNSPKPKDTQFKIMLATKKKFSHFDIFIGSLSVSQLIDTLIVLLSMQNPILMCSSSGSR